MNELIIEISAMIASMGVIAKYLSKWVTKQVAPLAESMRQMDMNSCKTHIVDFLSDIESGVKKTPVQVALACDLYDHYTADLNGNSYVHDKWESTKHKFLIGS